MLDSPDGLAPLAVIGLVLAYAAWMVARMVNAARRASADVPKDAAPEAPKAQAAVPKASGPASKTITKKRVKKAGAKAPGPAAGASSSAAPEALAALLPLSPSDDEDDAEVTQVTISPLSTPKAQTSPPTPTPTSTAPSTSPPTSTPPSTPPSTPTDDPDTDEVPPDRPSKVEVIFEDEADVEEITSPIGRILVSAWSQSDKGRVRKNNEDSLLVLPDQSVFAVADGMGGYKGGEIASALAVDTLRACFEKGTFDGRTESAVPVPRRGLELARAIQMANHAILERAKAEPSLENMGTTVVAARFSVNKQRVYIGHVGDSRCYRIRQGAIRQLTTDHTMERLGLKGPGADHLYQAVGIKPTMHIDMIVDKPRMDDLYVLCSDGLSKMASDEEIAKTAQDGELEACANALVELAIEHGGRDNVTVILVKIAERDVVEAAAGEGDKASAGDAAAG